MFGNLPMKWRPLLLGLVVFGIASASGEEVLLHWPGLESEVGTLRSMLELEGRTLTDTSVLVIEGKVFAGDERDLSLAGLTVRSADGKPAALYMNRLALTVSGDVLLEGGLLAVQSGKLRWSGRLVLGPDATGARKGELEYLFGDTLAAGGELLVGDGCSLTFRIFRGLDASKLTSGAAPPLTVEGAATLGNGVTVTLLFDEIAVSELAELPPGAYTILRAGSLEGPVPTLRIKRLSNEEPNERYALEIRGGDLVVNVTE